MGGRRGARFREPERDGVLRSELPADEGPRVRDEARTLVRRQRCGPGRPAHHRTEMADDGPLLHERLQGWLAAAVAHQAPRGERRTPPGTSSPRTGPS